MFGKLQKTFWMSKTTIQAVTCRLLKFIRNLKVLEDPGQRKEVPEKSPDHHWHGWEDSPAAQHQGCGPAHGALTQAVGVPTHPPQEGTRGQRGSFAGDNLCACLENRNWRMCCLSTSWRSGGCEVSFSLTLEYKVSDNWQIGSPHVSVGSLHFLLWVSCSFCWTWLQHSPEKPHLMWERKIPKLVRLDPHWIFAYMHAFLYRNTLLDCSGGIIQNFFFYFFLEGRKHNLKTIFIFCDAKFMVYNGMDTNIKYCHLLPKECRGLLSSRFAKNSLCSSIRLVWKKSAL